MSRPLTKVCPILLACLIVLRPNPAQAQQTAPPAAPELERRVRDLEDTVRRLEAERGPNQIPPDADRPDAGPPVGSPTPAPPSTWKRLVEAGWDNGFILRSPDDQFNLRITGQIQADSREFLNSPDTTDVDTFLVRRARLGIEADMMRYYEFRLLPDFGQGQAVVQDAYVNVHHWDCFQVEAGRFKQPVSYEQLIQDRFVPTLERSMIDQTMPQRDLGVMIHGEKLFGDRLDYAASLANGEINGNSTDTNNRKDWNGRVALRPFNSEFFADPLRLFQVGVSGSVGVEQEAASPNPYRTPATVPWLTLNANVRAEGERVRCVPELSYFYGPFGGAAEYLYERQRFSPAPGRYVDLPSEGYFVLATCLLTGEGRTTYSAPVVPLRDYDPLHPFRGTGAWEAVGRVSRLHLGSSVFAPGAARLADPTRYSSGATETTLGFNWYWNAWVRVQFNWEHAWFDQPVLLAPGHASKYQDSLLTRFQIIF